MQLSSDSFYQAVQYLENHPESIRVKKLVFCICKKTWENDLNILNALSLESLLKELIAGQETVEQLTMSLYRLVKTLNRPKVYAGVAKTIVEQLAPIYRQMTKETATVEIESNHKQTEVSDTNFLIEQATRNLTNHPETARIHKLIYAITKNSWENDLNRIRNYGLNNLIVEILEIYPSYNALKQAFLRLVNNINKKNLYLAISKVILSQINGLYDTLQEDEDTRIQGNNDSYSTQIIQVNPSENYGNMQPSAASAFETSVIDITSEQMVTELKQVQATPPPPPSPPKKTYDIFEIRLEIMQYTNPLRAKILLFSLVFHPWDRSGQDWSTLRSYALDDLLEQVIQSGRPIAYIEANLYKLAKSLNDPDSQLQAASTVIEAIKPFI
jgi:acetolactate synthase small subunit